MCDYLKQNWQYFKIWFFARYHYCKNLLPINKYNKEKKMSKFLIACVKWVLGYFVLTPMVKCCLKLFKTKNVITTCSDKFWTAQTNFRILPPGFSNGGWCKPTVMPVRQPFLNVNSYGRCKKKTHIFVMMLKMHAVIK